MSSNDDHRFDLPAPPPSEEGRKRAVSKAMAAFDEKYSSNRQASPSPVRPMSSTETISARPQRGRWMKREHMALAASIAVLLLSPIVVMRSGVMDQADQDQPIAAPTENKARSAPPKTAKHDKRAATVTEARPASVAPTPAPGPSVDLDQALGQALKKQMNAKPEEGAISGMIAGGDSNAARQAARAEALPKTSETQEAILDTFKYGGKAAGRPIPGAPTFNATIGVEENNSGVGLGVSDHTVEARSRSIEAQKTYGDVPASRVQATTSQPAETGRDRFEAKPANPFKLTQEEPVSTFSVDVDTASYSFMRSSLAQNVLPQQGSVRTEELINYFPYDYARPDKADEPFRISTSVFPSPWSEGRKILHVGIKGYAVQPEERPRANIVLLVDVSGSMSEPNKLPLLQKSLTMLTDTLDARDTIAIVTYAGRAGIALEPTPVSNKQKIIGAIERLSAGGSTAGAAGIQGAYALAEQNFDPKGVNRILLATDGDFNVGVTSDEELKSYIARKRETGIFLSVLGFGRGNYNDALMQTLAQNGNGIAAYIDTLNEARKVLVEEATSSLVPIAKDVKIQVEFNPAAVSEYRLIGYETRLLRREDFNNDKVDAGDVGSGHTVTALYEFAPTGVSSGTTDPLRYGGRVRMESPAVDPAARNEYAFVKLRYKLPKSDTSRLIETPVEAKNAFDRFEAAPQEARFATAVAAFGEILKGGQHTGKLTHDDVLRLASPARGEDQFGYRSEFLQLVRAAKTAR
jgi:Ca-activated chloride channel homolog